MGDEKTVFCHLDEIFCKWLLDPFDLYCHLT